MQAPSAWKSMLALRQATEGDKEFCWNLHGQTMRDYVDATWGWLEADQAKRFEASFDPSKVLIIELDEQPIGMLVVDLSHVPVRILSIEISPEHQKSGHGTAIISGIIERAAGQPVWLQVLKVNPARDLYERLGFVVVGETPTHWQMIREPPS
jgi:ribosomal protein S18 acetylase RimI-like enzyme